MEGRLYSTGSAAKVIGCDPQTLRKASIEGRVHYQWSGYFRTFKEEEVQRLRDLYKSGRPFRLEDDAQGEGA